MEGREGRRSGQREKSSYNSGQWKPQFNSHSSSEARMTPQSGPDMGQNGHAFVSHSQQSRNISYLRKGCELDKTALHTEAMPEGAENWSLFAGSSPSNWENKYFSEGRSGKNITMPISDLQTRILKHCSASAPFICNTFLFRTSLSRYNGERDGERDTSMTLEA